MIAELQALTLEQFQRAVADNLIRGEDPVETAAFSSPQLVQRTHAALDALIKQTNAQITLRRRQDRLDPTWERNARYFITQAGFMRRVIAPIAYQVQESQPAAPGRPSPRSRAAKRLQERHIEEYLDLVREEREAMVRENRERRRAQREQHRRGD